MSPDDPLLDAALYDEPANDGPDLLTPVEDVPIADVSPQDFSVPEDPLVADQEHVQGDEQAAQPDAFDVGPDFSFGVEDQAQVEDTGLAQTTPGEGDVLTDEQGVPLPVRNPARDPYGAAFDEGFSRPGQHTPGENTTTGAEPQLDSQLYGSSASEQLADDALYNEATGRPALRGGKVDGSLNAVLDRNPSLADSYARGGADRTHALEAAKLIGALHDRGLYDTYMNGNASQRNAIMRGVIQEVSADAASRVPYGKGRGNVFNNVKSSLGLTALTLRDLPEFQRGETERQRFEQGSMRSLQDQIVNTLRQRELLDTFVGDKKQQRGIANYVVTSLARDAATVGGKFDKDAYYKALDDYKGALFTLNKHPAFGTQETPAAPTAPKKQGGSLLSDTGVSVVTGAASLIPNIGQLTLGAADAALGIAGVGEEHGSRSALRNIRGYFDTATDYIDNTRKEYISQAQLEAEQKFAKSMQEGFGSTFKTIAANPRLAVTMLAQMAGGLGAGGVAVKGAKAASGAAEAWTIGNVAKASASTPSTTLFTASQGGSQGKEMADAYRSLTDDAQQKFGLYDDVRTRLAVATGRTPTHVEVRDAVANTIQSNAGVLSAAAGLALLRFGVGAEAAIGRIAAGEAGAAGGNVLTRVGASALGEVIQEAGEQAGGVLAQEIARSGVSPKAFTDTLADPTLRGAAAAGAILGAPFGIPGGHKTSPTAPDQVSPQAPESELLALPAPADFVAGENGGVGTTQDEALAAERDILAERYGPVDQPETPAQQDPLLALPAPADFIVGETGVVGTTRDEVLAAEQSALVQQNTQDVPRSLTGLVDEKGVGPLIDMARSDKTANQEAVAGYLDTLDSDGLKSLGHAWADGLGAEAQKMRVLSPDDAGFAVAKLQDEIDARLSGHKDVQESRGYLFDLLRGNEHTMWDAEQFIAQRATQPTQEAPTQAPASEATTLPPEAKAPVTGQPEPASKPSVTVRKGFEKPPAIGSKPVYPRIEDLMRWVDHPADYAKFAVATRDLTNEQANALASEIVNKFPLAKRQGMLDDFRFAMGQTAKGGKTRPGAYAGLVRTYKELVAATNPEILVGQEVTRAVDEIVKNDPPAVRAATKRIMNAGDESVEAKAAKADAAPASPAAADAAKERLAKLIRETIKAFPEIPETATPKQVLAAVGAIEQRLGLKIKEWLRSPDTMADWNSLFRPQRTNVAFGGRSGWATRRGGQAEVDAARAEPGIPQDMVETKAQYNIALAKLAALTREVTGKDPANNETSFRRGQRASDRGKSPITPGVLRAWAAAQEQRFKRLGLTVLVVDNDAHAATNTYLRERVAGRTGWAGLTWTSKIGRNPIVAINADYVADTREAQATLFHELYGHYGPKKVLGERTYRQLLGHVERMTRVDPHVRAIVRGVEKDYPIGESVTRETQLTEIMGRIAEGHGVPEYTPSFIERAGDIMRRFLAAAGLRRAKSMSYPELREFITSEVPRALDTSNNFGDLYVSDLMSQYKMDFGQATAYAKAPAVYNLSWYHRFATHMFNDMHGVTVIAGAEARTRGDAGFSALVSSFKTYLVQRTSIHAQNNDHRYSLVNDIETELKQLSERTGTGIEALRAHLGYQALALMEGNFHTLQWAKTVPLKSTAAAQRVAIMNQIYAKPDKDPRVIRQELESLASDPNNQIDPVVAAETRAGMDAVGVTAKQAADIRADLEAKGLWGPLLDIQEGPVQALRDFMLGLDFKSGRHNKRYIEFVDLTYYMPRKGHTREDSYALDFDQFNPFAENRGVAKGRGRLEFDERVPRNLLEGLYEEAGRSVRDADAHGLKQHLAALSPFMPNAIRVEKASSVLDGAEVAHPVYEGGSYNGFRYTNQPRGHDVGVFGLTRQNGDQYTVRLTDETWRNAWAADQTEETPLTGTKRTIGAWTKGFGRLLTQRNPGYLALAFQRDIIQDMLTATMEVNALGTPRAAMVKDFLGHVQRMTAGLGNDGDTVSLRRDVWSYFMAAEHADRQRVLDRINADPARRAAASPLLRYLDAKIPRDFHRQVGTQDELLGIERTLAGDKNAYQRAIGMLDGVGTSFDNIHRIALHETLLNAGVDPTEAARITAQTMDFNQRSEFGRRYGWIYMFLQTTLTGVDRVINKAVWSGLEAPYRTRPTIDEQGRETVEIYMDPKEAWDRLNKPLAGVLVTAGFLQVMFGAMAMGYDDKNESNAAKIAPGSWFRDILLGVGTASPIKIGMPYGEAQLLSSIGSAAALKALGYANTDQVVTELANVLLGNINPIGRVNVPDDVEHLGLSVLNGVMPSLVQPFAQYFTNLNAFGGPIDARDASYNKDKYASDKGFASTPEAWKEMATWMRENIGVDLTPESYRFVASNGGAIGRALTEIGKSMAVDQSDKSWVETLGSASGLLRTDHSANSFESRRMREYMNEYVNPALKDLNHAIAMDRATGDAAKQGDGRWTRGPRQEAYLRENPWVLTAASAYKTYVNDRAGLQAKARASAEKNPDAAWELSQQVKARTMRALDELERIRTQGR
ncbi:MAG: LPD38 domain-containing protein [Ilumatobacteraceae bacterium]